QRDKHDEPARDHIGAGPPVQFGREECQSCEPEHDQPDDEADRECPEIQRHLVFDCSGSVPHVLGALQRITRLASTKEFFMRAEGRWWGQMVLASVNSSALGGSERDGAPLKNDENTDQSPGPGNAVVLQSS